MLAIKLKVWQDREARILFKGLERIEEYLKGLTLDFDLLKWYRYSDKK